MSREPSWWLVLLLCILTLSAGAAGWYLVAFTGADATRFIDLAYIGFGAIVALATPPAVAAVAQVAAKKVKVEAVDQEVAAKHGL